MSQENVEIVWSLSMSARANHRRVTFSALLAGSLLAVLAAPSLAIGAGQLDPSFGRAGKVSTKFPDRRSRANAVAIDARGRIVAAGTGESRFFALARYKRNGHLDRSFGRHGRVITRFGPAHDRVPFQTAYAVLIDSRGRIVVAGDAGYSGQSKFALARYKPNGHLDHSFSADGRVRTNFRGDDASALGVAIDSRERLVAAGYTGDFPDWDFALARYKRNGARDRSFGTGGKLTTDVGAADVATSVAIDSRNRIVVAGDAGETGGCGEHLEGDFVVARYKRDGSPDPSFGTGGSASTDFGMIDGANAVVIDPHARIVAAGTTSDCTPNGSSEFALARYDRHGQPDASFGAGGMLTTNFHDGRYDQATSVAIDSHNRVVAAGDTADQPCFGDRCAGSRFALARYGHHGALDHSFSRNGKVANPHGNALSAAIDSRDRIVAAGVNAHRFALARYIG
jgi:uncharacterized delta-60 repeat protein